MTTTERPKLYSSAVCFDMLMENLSKADLAECVLHLVARAAQMECSGAPGKATVCDQINGVLLTRGTPTLKFGPFDK